MIRTATFSPDRYARYTLGRDWSDELVPGEGCVVWILCNPSTADKTQDDPTIRRVIRFSQRWGFERALILNLSPVRSPSPRVAWNLHTSCAPRYLARNVGTIEGAVMSAERVVAAWGNVGEPFLSGELRAVLAPVDLLCLGTTGGGAPKHPLARGRHRVPDDFAPQPFTLYTPSATI